MVSAAVRLSSIWSNLPVDRHEDDRKMGYFPRKMVVPAEGRTVVGFEFTVMGVATFSLIVSTR